MIAFVLEGLGTGQLNPYVDKVFPFEQMADAQRRVLNNQQSGKVVVRVA